MFKIIGRVRRPKLSTPSLLKKTIHCVAYDYIVMVIVGGAHFGGGELSDGIEASEKRLYSIRTPGFQ